MIYLGADHRGFKLKEKIKNFLKKLGYSFDDIGNRDFNANDDYPDFAKEVAERVSRSPKNLGILFCGSGIGMSIAANKFKGIRAALCFNKRIARLSRQHNDSNILCLPADFLSQKETQAIIKTWLSTEFSKEKRHQRRIKKLKTLEKLQ